MLFTPRDLRWNLAGAVGAAAVLLLVVAGIVARNAGPPPAPPIADGPTPAAPSSVLVRLVIVQPGARSVEVAGDFNGWNPARTPLDEVSAGAWAVTIPLKPGRYEYMYVVDGQQWIVDPFAVEQTDDGFGSRNAVLDVRPVPRAVEWPARASGAL